MNKIKELTLRLPIEQGRNKGSGSEALITRNIALFQSQR
jgi:hypothetical protein